jgi:hypothetical protein
LLADIPEVSGSGYQFRGRRRRWTDAQVGTRSGPVLIDLAVIRAAIRSCRR